MTDPQDPPVNNTPAGEPQLELPGARKLRELDEMRHLAKRLEALEPPARKRVLDWLNAHFAGS